MAAALLCLRWRWRPWLLAFPLLICHFNLLMGIGGTQEPFGDPISKVPLLMPHVAPREKETYLCTAFKTPRTDIQYIVGFEPNATSHTAHHILLYGCEGGPGYVERDTPRAVWDCGEMARGRSGYPLAPTCDANSGASQIIYAWARDAPALKLPKGVGFKIGKGTEINYIVLQVHYADVSHFVNGATDDSGIVLDVVPSTTTQVTKLAGVYLLGTGGMIPAKSVEHMEVACRIQEKLTFYPFAFRTHTHKLGVVVSGYLVSPDNHWERIGKHDPQQPQMFYPIKKHIPVRQGDMLTARCTMNNTLNHAVYVGATADDEMCNFYVMYYVDGDEDILDQKYCFSSGPPIYRWHRDPRIDYVPPWINRDASTLDAED